jgi:hypothetical protein
MKISDYMKSEPCVPPVKRSGRFLKGVDQPALLLSIVGLTIAFGSGCSSTGGFNVHLAAPATSSSQDMDSTTGNGWYHPPESPGVVPFGEA